MIRYSRTFFCIALLAATFLAGCSTKSPEQTEAVYTAEPKAADYVAIGGMQIDKADEAVDLRGKNIDDISPLYEMDNLKALDIRNNPVEQQDVIEFMEKEPGCAVLWSVALASEYYDSNAESIDFTDNENFEYEEAADVLAYFPGLKAVELQCGNLSAEQYHGLQAMYPEIKINMSVQMCGEYYDADTKEIVFAECEDINIDALAYFNHIEKVDFGENILDTAIMDTALEICPDAEFVWNVELLDEIYSSSEKEIDVSYTPVLDFADFKSRVKYLTSLQKINMTYCYLKNDQMEELTEEYPDVKFIWRVRVGSWELSTDVKAFSTGKKEVFDGIRYYGDGDEKPLLDDDIVNLKYCTDLEALDIGHQMYITDFSFLEHMPKLKILIVAWTQLTDITLITHLQDLEYLEIFSNKIEDFSALSQLPNLKYLNCSNNEMDNIDVFLDMPQLEKLWLVSCENISPEDRQRLTDGLPDCEIVFDAASPTNGGWRSRDNEVYAEMRKIFGLRPNFYD